MRVDVKSNMRYISNSAYVKCYLDDIRSFQIISAEEEHDLFIKIKEGDEVSRNRVITNNQRFVYSVAKRYARNESHVLDIVNEANIGLIRAIETFDPTKGIKFISYAVWWMIREINTFLMENENIVKRSNVVKTYSKLNTIKNNFFVLNGRMPSEYELISLFQEKYNIKLVSEKDIYEIVCDSFNNEDNEEDYSFDNSLFSIGKCNSNDFYKNENSDYNIELIKNLMKNLNKREKDIILSSFEINNNLNNIDLKSKYNLTEERIRQIKIKAIDKMKLEYEKISKDKTMDL